MSLAVVGGIHPNKDGSNRLFEIAMCLPGEPVQLVCEPRNRHDPSAVAVLNARGNQLGYLSADRCGWIGAKITQGEDIQAAFQQAKGGSAIIRVSFSGSPPTLPKSSLALKPGPVAAGDEFYPDELPDDDWT